MAAHRPGVREDESACVQRTFACCKGGVGQGSGAERHARLAKCMGAAQVRVCTSIQPALAGRTLPPTCRAAGPGHEPVVFVGRTEGRIVPARGPTDFG